MGSLFGLFHVGDGVACGMARVSDVGTQSIRSLWEALGLVLYAVILWN